jgi:hypothetical protein
LATAAACSSVIVGAMSEAPVETRLNHRAFRRLRPNGTISASTKTISFTGCRFDLAQLADAEAAGAFALPTLLRRDATPAAPRQSWRSPTPIRRRDFATRTRLPASR